MQYQVPQFIEVEDKIFGPLTFKQFIYVAGAGGACLIFFTLLPMWIAIVLSLPFVAVGGALAFYKVNDRPFVHFLENAVAYYSGSRLYLWKQREVKPATSAATTPPLPAPLSISGVSESKLKDLAWSLNIKDRQQMGIRSQGPTGFEI